MSEGPLEVALNVAGGDLRDPWERAIWAVPENPDDLGPIEDFDDFRWYIAVTGGLDSTALVRMADAAGIPTRLVYVQLGQEYADAELQALDDLGLSDRLIEVTAPMPPTRLGHILPARNYVILAALDHAAVSRGEVGYAALGAVAGEMPMTGGDKSWWFMHGVAYRLTRLIPTAPLAFLEKSDLVRWLVEHDHHHDLRNVKACLHPTLRACGRCQTCFRYHIALCAARRDNEAAVLHDNPRFEQYVEKYAREAARLPHVRRSALRYGLLRAHRSQPWAQRSTVVVKAIGTLGDQRR